MKEFLEYFNEPKIICDSKFLVLELNSFAEQIGFNKGISIPEYLNDNNPFLESISELESLDWQSPTQFGEINLLGSDYSVQLEKLRNSNYLLSLLKVNNLVRVNSQELLESLPIGFIFSTIDGNIIDINQSALQLLRYDNKATIIESKYNIIMDLFAEQDSGMEIKQRINNGEENLVIESGMKRKDNSTFYGRIVINAKKNKNDKIDHIESFIFDISKEIEQESQIKDSEKKYRELFSYMQLGFAYHEIITENGKPVDYRYVDINPAFEKMLGLSKAKVIGNTSKELFPMLEDYWIKNFGEVALTGRSKVLKQYSAEFERYFNVIAYSPKPRYFAVLFFDITDQQKALEALKEKETQFELIANNIEEVFWIRNNDKILFINKGYEKVWGKSCLSIYENPNDFINSIYSEDRDWVVNELKKVYSQNIAMDIQYRIVTPKGKIKWVWEKTFSVGDKFDPSLRVGIANDITAIKGYEKELLIAKEKAEESNKLKSSFIANISHEIRTPLNTVTGFSELLSLDDLEADEKQEYIKMIKQNSTQLVKVIDSIIDLSELQSGIIKINYQWCSINDIFRSLINSYKSILKKDNFEIVSNIPDENEYFFIDQKRVKKILDHLLDNAIKFTLKGTVQIDCRYDGSKLEIQIIDTGIGIEEDKQELIFNEFRQIEDHLNRQYGGLGVGLPISKSLAEMMDGSLKIYSKYGIGTTAVLSIPTKRKYFGDTSSLKNGISKFKNFSILIVEDDDSNLLLMERFLKIMEFDVLKAPNGFKAIELYKSNPQIDIVLTDIMMPEMSGYELINRFKEINSNIPILATTARASDADYYDLLSAGFSDVIGKPIRRNELSEKIVKYLII